MPWRIQYSEIEMQDSKRGAFLMTAHRGGVESVNEKDSSAPHGILIDGGVVPANIER
jgi:hypothetical protein